MTVLASARLRVNSGLFPALSCPRERERVIYLLFLATLTRRWRHFRSTLPDRSAIELNREAIRRIDCAFVGPLDPDTTGVVDPSSRWQSRLVQDVEFPAILRDVGKAALRAETQRHALPSTAQIAALRRCAGCYQSCRKRNRGQHYFHGFSPSQLARLLCLQLTKDRSPLILHSWMLIPVPDPYSACQSKSIEACQIRTNRCKASDTKSHQWKNVSGRTPSSQHASLGRVANRPHRPKHFRSQVFVRKCVRLCQVDFRAIRGDFCRPLRVVTGREPVIPQPFWNDLPGFGRLH